MKRDNMIVYRSFYEAIIDLPSKNQAEVWKAVFELGLYGNQVELTGISNTIFKLIKPQIEANIKRYENGKSRKISKPEANIKQTESKSVTNNNKNKNKNINARKKEFVLYLKQFENEYPKQLLKDFEDYWTEHGINDIKMRFEKEKTFGVSRRLRTWSKNNFNNYETKQDDKLVNHIKKQLGK